MRTWAWLWWLMMFCPGLSALDLTGYGAVDGRLADGREALRSWYDGGRPRLLVADPTSLVTEVVDGSPADLVPWTPGQTTLDRLKAAAQLRRNGLENAGIRRAEPPRPGAWLTFDLCPSHRPLDRSVFIDLEQDGVPLPVMLEISGLWIEHHQKDLNWLVAERNAGRLAVTWVNHTETHDYLPGKPLGENFLLLPGTDLKEEVFRLEKRLLARGEVPSVFFRFPGLISSPALVDQVLALGLVPLGSSGWLAKEQTVKNGTLVLTHANGNEPEGLELLTAWDHSHRPDIASGRWHWLGLEDWEGAKIPPP